MFTFASIIAAVMTKFGDIVHYMNRDITDWIYAVQGFIAAINGFSWIL